MQYKKRNNTDTHSKTKMVATLGIAVALILILQLFAELLQKLGMPMSFALGLIPVLVISQTHGTKYGLICGTFFGLISLIMAVIGASAVPMYAVAINPLVSVFPRLMVGLICGVAYKFLSKLSQKRNHNPTNRAKKCQILATSAISTLLGVLTNSILFLSMFLAFAHGNNYNGLVIDFRWLLASVVALNTIVELILFTILVPSIVLPIVELKTKRTQIVANNDTPSENVQDENVKDLTD